MRPPLAQVAGKRPVGNQKGSTQGSNSRYNPVIRRSDDQRRPKACPPEGHLCVTSHPDLSSDLPRSLQLGPSAFPSQRVCGPLALNEKYAMPETVIDVSLENLKSIAWLETSWKELEARVTHSFFLSWLWIGTWLRHIPDGAQPHVLVARRQARSLAWRLFAGGERGVSGGMRGHVGCSMKQENFVSTDCSSNTIIYLQSNPMPSYRQVSMR
jgi:hypothetical protein